MSVETIRNEKAVLRQKFKQLRRGFKPPRGARTELARNLTKLLSEFSETEIALYRAHRDEAPCQLEPSDRFFYPRIKGEDLEFLQSGRAFVKHAWGIHEPDPKHSIEGHPALICCPAVAVDLNGGRIGLGKGYYDRYFSHHPEAIRIGVVYQVQVSPHPLPAESWDQALDWIVSEKMILRTRTSTRSS